MLVNGCLMSTTGQTISSLQSTESFHRFLFPFCSAVFLEDGGNYVFWGNWYELTVLKGAPTHPLTILMNLLRQPPTTWSLFFFFYFFSFFAFFCTAIFSLAIDLLLRDKKINAASSCGQVGKKECHKTRSGCSGDRIENATASENNQQDLVFQQNMEIFRRCASISWF